MDAWMLMILLIVAITAAWKVTLGFALVILVQQLFREFGLLSLAGAGIASYTTVQLYFASILAFITGYALAVLTVKRRGSDPARLRPLPESVVYAVVSFAGLLCLYHLVVGGIPIFSANIETDRFDFTSSGLFGIPGRMYLFGVTISWILATANARAHEVPWHTYRPWQLATGFMLVSALLSGFKGEVLSLGMTVICVISVIAHNRITLGVALKRYWWIVPIGVGYFAYVAALYPTYNSSSQGLGRQFLDRLTSIPAQPAQYAIEGLAIQNGPTPVFADFEYFLSRYTGNEIAGSYSFERAVSSALIGIDPSSLAWSTPVTVGGFAELYVSFGFLLACAIIGFAGYFLGRNEYGVQKSTLGLVGRAVLGVVLLSWMVKGGVAYHMLNYAAVIALLAVVGTAAWLTYPVARRFFAPRVGRVDDPLAQHA